MAADDTSNTRQRLIEAAITMMEQGGESAVRIKTVAAMAHITEPSVYHFFGSRSGLIEAAQIERFHRSQHDVVSGFAAMIRDCTSQEQFFEIVRQVLLGTYSESRAPFRSIRAEIIGSAQSRPALREVVVEAQHAVHVALAEQIEFAKSKGWVRADLDGLAFATWITSLNNGRSVVDLDPKSTVGEAWNQISLDLVMHALAPTDR